jgi:hypothetical protein
MESETTAVKKEEGAEGLSQSGEREKREDGEMDVEKPKPELVTVIAEPRIQSYLSKEENNRILHVVESNADLWCRKLGSLVPDTCPDHPISHTVPINNRVAMLLDAAVDPVNLARISPYYQPWF